MIQHECKRLNYNLYIGFMVLTYMDQRLLDQELSHEEQVKRDYYDLVGQWNLPIVHMGGLAATDELLALLQVKESDRVLDVGCGTGFTACQIARTYNCRVVGIDISGKMIERSKERVQKERLQDKVEFQVADVTQLPFDDDSFDVLIMESFLNILEGPNIIKKALKEISRVVKPGGRVGANEVCADEETPPELMAYIREQLKGSMGPGQGLAQYTMTEFKEFFEGVGLHITYITKKPPMDIGWDIIKVMGLYRFIRYSIRAIYDLITNAELRKAVRQAAPAKRVMEKKKDTKKYFGYALIVAQK